MIESDNQFFEVHETNEKYQDKYRIESTRLQNWDYSWNGYYFITICTKNKQPFFGNIENGIMILNEIGKIAEKFWLEIPEHFDNVKLDEFVIMPDHVHGILVIKNENNQDTVINDKSNDESQPLLVSYGEIKSEPLIVETRQCKNNDESQPILVSYGEIKSEPLNVETRQCKNNDESQPILVSYGEIKSEPLIVETRQCKNNDESQPILVSYGEIKSEPLIVETRQCLVSTHVDNNINIGKKRFQNQGKKSISSIIGSYKSICTKTINKMQNEIFFAWQSRFHDRIIHDETELNNIRKYIIDNPMKKWQELIELSENEE